MPNRLNVILTGTTNPYLVGRLPLRGEIELCELSTVGTVTTAVFRILDDDGFFGVPVHVTQPVFTYDPVVAADINAGLGRYVVTLDCGDRIEYRPGGSGSGAVPGRGTVLRCVRPACRQKGRGPQLSTVVGVEKRSAKKHLEVSADNALAELPWAEGCESCGGLRTALAEEGPIHTLLEFLGSHFEQKHSITIVAG